MSLRDYLSTGTNESSKRLIAFGAFWVLGLSSLSLVFALTYQACRNWAVSAVIAGSFALVAGYLAWMVKALFVVNPDKTDGDKQP